MDKNVKTRLFKVLKIILILLIIIMIFIITMDNKTGYPFLFGLISFALIWYIIKGTMNYIKYGKFFTKKKKKEKLLKENSYQDKDINKKIEVNKSNKKMSGTDWVSMLGALFIASIIFQLGNFGFLPAFIITMLSYWILKQIILSFSKKDKPITKLDNNKNVVKKSKKIWLIIIIPSIIIIGVYIFAALNNYENTISDEEYENYLTENYNYDDQIIKTDKDAKYSEYDNNLYRNTKYNFRIKFPEGWEIKNGDGPNIIQKATHDGSSISIGVQEFPEIYKNESFLINDFTTIEEYKDEMSQNLQELFPDSKFIDYGEQKLDNIPAYWIKYSTTYTALDITVEGIILQYQILYKNITYTITMSSPYDKYKLMEPILFKSISTFVLENKFAETKGEDLNITEPPAPAPAPAPINYDNILSEYKIDAAELDWLSDELVDGIFNGNTKIYCSAIVDNKYEKKHLYYLYNTNVDELINKYSVYRDKIEFIDNNLYGRAGTSIWFQEKCAEAGYIINP